MPDLRQQLQSLFRGRICLVGLGNTDLGDDGFGVRLAEELKARFCPEIEAAVRARKQAGFRRDPLNPRDAKSTGSEVATRVLVAGTTPENHIGRIMREDWTHVLFLDAADFGAEPGAAVLMDSSAIAARFPQVSTHKISLALLAKLVQGNGYTKAWLLGVQPESLAPGTGLSPKVQTSLELLRDLLVEVRAGESQRLSLEAGLLAEMGMRRAARPEGGPL